MKLRYSIPKKSLAAFKLTNRTKYMCVFLYTTYLAGVINIEFQGLYFRARAAVRLVLNSFFFIPCSIVLDVEIPIQA